MRQLRITQSYTLRDSSILNRYISDIGKIPMISLEEEIHLTRQAREGNGDAIDKLVTSNLRFVVSVAKQYQNQGLALPDLINEGNIGLIKAAKRFDETRGFKFISYAVWWIRQSILHALAEKARIVRLPYNKISANNRVSQEISRFEQDFDREPTNEELQLLLADCDLETIVYSRAYGKHHKSLDATISIEGGETLLDTLACSREDLKPDIELWKESLRRDIFDSLSVLTLRQSEIVKMYMGLSGEEPMTLEEIGDYFDLTRERVRQIKDEAIMCLKNNAQIKKMLISYN